MLGQRMGNAGLKLKFGRKCRKQRGPADEEGQPDRPDDELSRRLRAEREAEGQRLWQLKALIVERPSVFLLDNLLMSIQFFTNYEK